jgi:hypothetical protein
MGHDRRGNERTDHRRWRGNERRIFHRTRGKENAAAREGSQLGYARGHMRARTGHLATWKK